MNLDARKLKFVQEFLNRKSEEVISQFESILMNEKMNTTEQFEPMTQYDLEKRIEQSEVDFQHNRYKSSTELLQKFNFPQKTHP